MFEQKGIRMEHELKIKGFSSVSEKEMLEIDGGKWSWGITIGVIASGIGSIFGIIPAIIGGIAGSIVGSIIDNN